METRNEVLEYTLLADLVKTHKMTTLQRSAGILGFAMGVIATYYEFSLGYQFAGNFGITNPRTEAAIKIIFGSATSIPAASLIGMPTHDYFVNLFDFTLNKKVTSVNHPIVLKALSIATHILALPAGVPFAYQVGTSLEGILPLQVLTVTSCFAVSFACAKQGLESFYLKPFLKTYRIEDDLTKLHREELSQALTNILHNMPCVHNDVIKHLYSYYSAHLHTPDFDNLFFAQIKRYFHINTSYLPVADLSKINKAATYTGDFVAGSLGVVATATLYLLALNAGDWVCDFAGVDEPKDREAIKHSIAATGTMTTCLFMANAAMESLRAYIECFRGKPTSINQSVSHKPLRRSIHGFSILIGLISAIPNLQLSLQQNANYAYNICVFAGQSLTQILPINILLQNLVSLTDGRFYANNIDSQRDFFNQIIRVLRDKINWRYDAKQIHHLHTTICGSKPKYETSIGVNNLQNPQSPLSANSLFRVSTVRSEIELPRIIRKI